MNNKITYRKEGDYFIPNLYIKNYKKKRLQYWKVWSFKT